jgi:hypothetical protein
VRHPSPIFKIGVGRWFVEVLLVIQAAFLLFLEKVREVIV